LIHTFLKVDLIVKKSFNWARLKGHLFEEEWAEIFFAEIEKWQ